MFGGAAITKALVIGVLTFLLAAGRLIPQTVDVPAADFVEALVQGKGASLWERDPPESPAGGYLFRFELAAGNDDSLLLFFAASVDCQTSGCPWTIYYRPRESGYRKLQDSIFLPSSAISKTETEGRFIFSVLLLNGREGNELQSFGLDSAGSFKSTSRELTPEELNILSDGVRERPSDERLQAAFDVMDKLQKTIVSRQIEKVLLADFQHDSTISWTPVNPAFSLSQQYRNSSGARPSIGSSPTVSPTADSEPNSEPLSTVSPTANSEPDSEPSPSVSPTATSEPDSEPSPSVTPASDNQPSSESSPGISPASDGEPSAEFR